MFIIFAVPPEGSASLSVGVCWKLTLLLEEEKNLLLLKDCKQKPLLASVIHWCTTSQNLVAGTKDSYSLLLSGGSVGGLGSAGWFPCWAVLRWSRMAPKALPTMCLVPRPGF